MVLSTVSGTVYFVVSLSLRTSKTVLGTSFDSFTENGCEASYLFGVYSFVN